MEYRALSGIGMVCMIDEFIFSLVQRRCGCMIRNSEVPSLLSELRVSLFTNLSIGFQSAQLYANEVKSPPEALQTSA